MDIRSVRFVDVALLLATLLVIGLGVAWVNDALPEVRWGKHGGRALSEAEFRATVEAIPPSCWLLYLGSGGEPPTNADHARVFATMESSLADDCESGL